MINFSLDKKIACVTFHLALAVTHKLDFRDFPFWEKSLQVDEKNIAGSKGLIYVRPKTSCKKKTSDLLFTRRE